MSDHKLDRTHSDDFINHVVSEAEIDAAMSAKVAFEKKEGFAAYITPLVAAELDAARSDLARKVLAEIGGVDPYYRSTSPRVGNGYVTGNRKAEDFKRDVTNAITKLFTREQIELGE